MKINSWSKLSLSKLFSFFMTIKLEGYAMIEVIFECLFSVFFSFLSLINSNAAAAAKKTQFKFVYNSFFLLKMIGLFTVCTKKIKPKNCL